MKLRAIRVRDRNDSVLAPTFHTNSSGASDSAFRFARRVVDVGIEDPHWHRSTSATTGTHNHKATALLSSTSSAIASVWLIGATLMLCLSGVRLRRAHKIKVTSSNDVPEWISSVCTRLANQMYVWQTVSVAHSKEVLVPTLIGWLRPVVLIPTAMLCEIRPRHLELIIAHEMAHIRRCDFVVNLAQTVVESLLFFHPCVWWLSNQIRHQREYCADDMVIALTRERAAYVDALLQIESRPDQLYPGLAVTDGSLVARVRRISEDGSHGLQGAEASARTVRYRATVGAIIALLGLCVLWAQPNSRSATPQELREHSTTGKFHD